VKVTYDERPAITSLDDPKAGDGMPMDAMTKEWGDAAAALAAAPVRIEHEYKTPREYNVPIEPHGLIARWEGDSLTFGSPANGSTAWRGAMPNGSVFPSTRCG
jgi:Aerobic-type carbon monoxide dehydrogenase, large subunit CoxL/CutL homologs